ncbi:MAG: DUF1697 domain-containing protein [Bacilli bacterium]|jgi:hypothetical protein|nr:DUF1697 domain-containing protein [Bacilli bacterium]
MKKYIALLRGVNIGGKNKISMVQLKTIFEEFGFKEVKTYLNSGNVIFSSNEDNMESLTKHIEMMIKNKFNLDIPVLIISKEELKDILQNAPEWWDNKNKEIYDNLIFIMPPLTFSEVFGEIGEPKKGLERIKNYKKAIFWSFCLKEYQKTNWWTKTASKSIKDKLTIRTATTIKKIVEM